MARSTDRPSVIGSTFAWYAALLVALELVFWLTIPYRTLPRADTASRNAAFERAWPEYLDVETECDGTLVVNLSASQAVGREVADSSLIYPALLGKALQDKDGGVCLENWSSGGMRTVEMELLSIKAVTRRADLVVMSFGYVNFDPEFKLNLDFPFTDIPLLAGEPEVWPYLGETSFGEKTGLDDIASRVVQRHSWLARSRAPVTDAVVQSVPLAWHRWVVGRQIQPKPRLDGARDPASSIFWVDQAATLAEWQEVEDERKRKSGGQSLIHRGDVLHRYPYFERVITAIDERFDEAGIKWIWVWQPVDLSVIPPESQANLRWFIARASAKMAELGAPVYDLHGAISPERFLTPVHFDEAGHALMAEKMREVIEDEL